MSLNAVILYLILKKNHIYIRTAVQEIKFQYLNYNTLFHLLKAVQI